MVFISDYIDPNHYLFISLDNKKQSKHHSKFMELFEGWKRD